VLAPHSGRRSGRSGVGEGRRTCAWACTLAPSELNHGARLPLWAMWALLYKLGRSARSRTYTPDTSQWECAEGAASVCAQLPALRLWVSRGEWQLELGAHRVPKLLMSPHDPPVSGAHPVQMWAAAPSFVLLQRFEVYHTPEHASRSCQFRSTEAAARPLPACSPANPSFSQWCAGPALCAAVGQPSSVLVSCLTLASGVAHLFEFAVILPELLDANTQGAHCRRSPAPTSSKSVSAP
jgi:hypothetical protein